MTPHTSIITVAGGRKGTGRTNFCLNLALAFIQGGRKVGLLDGGGGMAGVDILLGLSPYGNVLDFIEEKTGWEDVRLTGPLGLEIFPGGALFDKIHPKSARRLKKIGELKSEIQKNEILIIDAPAGASDPNLQLLAAAHLPMVILNPDRESAEESVKTLEALARKASVSTVFIVLNKVPDAKQAGLVFKSFQTGLGLEGKIALKPIGFVLEDENVSEAGLLQEPLLLQFPDSPAALCFGRIAGRLLPATAGAGPSPNMSLVFDRFFSAPPDSPPPPPPDPEPAVQARPESGPAPLAEKKISGIGPIELLLEEGLFDAGQLEQARKFQQDKDPRPTLLEVLLELQHVTLEELRDIFGRHPSRLDLASLLPELGLTSAENMDRALEAWKKSGPDRALPDVLAERGLVSSYQLALSLAWYLGLEYVEPDPGSLPAELIDQVPRKILQESRFLPLGRSGGRVRAAVADPFDQKALAEARRFFGDDLELVLTLPRFIHQALAAFDRSRDRRSTGEASPQVDRFLEWVLDEAVKQGFEEIHFEPGPDRMGIRVRQNGLLEKFGESGRDNIDPLAVRLRSRAGLEESEPGPGRIEWAVGGEGSDTVRAVFEADFFMTRDGGAAVLFRRDLPAALPDPVNPGRPAGLFENLLETARTGKGLIVWAGPRGSGKTSALYSAARRLAEPGLKTVVIDEPGSPGLEGALFLGLLPLAGLGLAEALDQALGQAPDILILGQTGDRAGAEGIGRAAAAGVLTLTTIRAEDAAGALESLALMTPLFAHRFPPATAAAAQRLLRAICPDCRRPARPSPDQIDRLGLTEADLESVEFFEGAGCEACGGSGFQGLVSAMELISFDDRLVEKIGPAWRAGTIRRLAREESGLISLAESGLILAAQGRTTLEEALKLIRKDRPVRPPGLIMDRS